MRAPAHPIFVVLLSLPLLAALACDSGPSIEDVRAMQAEGRFAASLEPLRALLETEPDDPEVHFLYGTALNRTTSSPIAVWSLRKAAEDPEWSARANLELAASSMQNADFDAAIDYATLVLEEEPDSVVGRSLRGMGHLNQGRAEQALVDFDHVLEVAPNDESARAARAAALLSLDRVDEAVEAIAMIDAVPEGRTPRPTTQALVCVTRATLEAERGNTEAAAEGFDACLAEQPLDPTVIERSIAFFDEVGRRERGTQILEAVLERSPGSAAYRTRLSARAVADGDDERAEAILLAGTERPDPRTRTAAWTDLTNLYLQRGELDRAIDSYREAVALSPRPSPLSLLTLADLLARAERHEEALAVAQRLERDSYRGLIEARVHLNEGRPARALARLDEVFPTWPNNPGARYYAARAAEQLGDFERAIEEYRQSVRSGPEQTEAGLRLAQLYLAAGSRQNAWNSAAQYFRGHRDDPEAIRVLLRAASGAENSSMNQLLSGLAGGPLWPTAVAMRAQRLEASQGPEEALALLDSAKGLELTRPENAEVLETRTRLLLALDKPSEALAASAEAVAAAPESGRLRAIHGRVLGATGAPEAEVRSTLEKAVELAPDDWLALEALGEHLEAQGEIEAALAHYRRAAEAAPSEAGPGRAVARALARIDRPAEAEAAWEAHLIEQPWDVEAALALTRLRLAAGRLDDRTVELAERAVLFRGGPRAQDLLIEVHRARGEDARAEALETARAERRPLAPTRITPIEGATG